MSKPTETIYDKIGSCIKWLRADRGMTQEELAAASNVSVQTVSNAECGRRTTLDALCAMAEGLDYDPVGLLAAAISGAHAAEVAGPGTARWVVAYGKYEGQPAEWKDKNDAVVGPGSGCKCSVCGDFLDGSDEYSVRARYCPNCGRYMMGKIGGKG